jgi:hypothetical protein
MAIWVVPIILALTPMPGLLSRSIAPVLFQIQPSTREYGDSPRPSPVSRMHMTESVSAKFLIKKVEPVLPPASRAADLRQSVIFRIVLGKDGRVEEIHLRRGKPALIEAAAKAVSEWQYRPYLFDGRPTEVETFATVRFRISP